MNLRPVKLQLKYQLPLKKKVNSAKMNSKCSPKSHTVSVCVCVAYIGNGTDGQGNQVGLIIGLSVGGCAFLGMIFLVFTRRCKRGPTSPTTILRSRWLPVLPLPANLLPASAIVARIAWMPKYVIPQSLRSSRFWKQTIITFQ